MTDRLFAIGDRVFYILSRGYSRPEQMYFPAHVVNVTPKRIVIRLDGERQHRNVSAWSLTKERPHQAS